MRIEFLCISVLRLASGPRVKFVGAAGGGGGGGLGVWSWCF